jgi:putative spermidine/putrescine transport system permease protein
VHVIFTSTGVVIALAQVLLPFMVLTLVSAMNHIDTSLEDAARTLGSSRMRCFLRVTLPLLMPGILAGSLLVFAISISTFVTPALVGGAGAEVMSMTIYTNATQIGNMGLASSASMVLLIMTIIIISIYYRLTASSVKINEGE